jgi:lipoprotein-anchoring transpeptidase ErfK/SrfK
MRAWRRRAERSNRRRSLTVLGVLGVLAIAGVALATGAIGSIVGTGNAKVARATAAGPSASSLAPSTTAALPAGSSYIATAIVPEVAVFASPDAPGAAQTFANPRFISADSTVSVPLVFGVIDRHTDGWVQVRLPVRPNGSTGWVRSSDVSLTLTTYRIEIELSAHRLRAFRGGEVIIDEPVATGAPATPTPTGSFFIVELLKAPTAGTVYGPYAYGLSGHSDALQTFDGGDAEVGIHGNDDASVLGRSISHGCIRMSNEGVTKLAALLPLGTPVTISA